jgi:spermidine synthase
VKPWKTLATAGGEQGRPLLLQERDGVFVIRVGGHPLMSSAQHGSEQSMARAALEQRRGAARVLIGGLGLGYTVRAALDLLPPDAEVVVAELFAAVVEWNRGPLAHLACAPLDDPRVRVEVDDVRRVMSRPGPPFDAILLDVDNGPQALSRAGNEALYSREGLHAAHRALRSGGILVVWSAGPDARFLRRLGEAGFQARERAVAAREGSGSRHTLFVATRSD